MVVGRWQLERECNGTNVSSVSLPICRRLSALPTRASLGPKCIVCAEKIWIPQGRFYPEAIKNACLHLKQIPLDFSKSCEAVNKGLTESIQILDRTMSESEYQKTIQAFDHTITSLEAAEKSVSSIQRDIELHSLTFLIVMLALSIGLFANGMVCILETKKELKPR